MAGSHKCGDRSWPEAIKCCGFSPTTWFCARRAIAVECCLATCRYRTYTCSAWKMEDSRGKQAENGSRGKLTTRREQLYGPARTEAREAAQRLQRQDHVFENFQRGIGPIERSEAFQSETIASFRVYSLHMRLLLIQDHVQSIHSLKVHPQLLPT